MEEGGQDTNGAFVHASVKVHESESRCLSWRLWIGKRDEKDR